MSNGKLNLNNLKKQLNNSKNINVIYSKPKSANNFRKSINKFKNNVKPIKKVNRNFIQNKPN